MSEMQVGSTDVPASNGITAGKVKWFNAAKGFGFITVDGDDKDIFVHVKELRKSNIVGLNDGDAVEFTPIQGPKGRYATCLKLIT
jgi:CspA family cold shock protein